MYSSDDRRKNPFEEMVEEIVRVVVTQLVIAIFVLLGQILRLIWEYREEIGEAIVAIVVWTAKVIAWLAVGTWTAILFVGGLILLIGRDALVRYLWKDTFGDRMVRAALVCWLFVLPVLVPAGIGSLGTILLARLFSRTFDLPLWLGVWPGFALCLPLIGRLVYGYYNYYSEHPVVHHYRWPRFEKEYSLLLADIRLNSIVRRTERQIDQLVKGQSA